MMNVVLIDFWLVSGFSKVSKVSKVYNSTSHLFFEKRELRLHLALGGK